MTSSAHNERLRVMEVLRRQKDHVGSYDGLARQIGEAKGIKFDRRKLKSLVEGHDVSLRITELAALDAYLAPFGEGFSAQPMFEESAILAEIVRSMQATFILGSYPRRTYGRFDISNWDVRSMIEILRNLNRYGRVPIDIEEVRYRPHGELEKRAVEDEGWFDRVANDRSTLVCVGSPRVNPATELLLAEMFGTLPFEPESAKDLTLPFRFVWPKREGFVSSFDLDEARLVRHDRGFAKKIAAGDTAYMGLAIGDRWLPVHRHGRRWSTYGIIAAQRRHTGQVWLVLAGLSGPSTFAATTALRTLANAVPRAETGKSSAVLSAVVEATVEVDETLLGDQRVVSTQRIIEDPRVTDSAGLDLPV